MYAEEELFRGSESDFYLLYILIVVLLWSVCKRCQMIARNSHWPMSVTVYTATTHEHDDRKMRKAEIKV